MNAPRKISRLGVAMTAIVSLILGAAPASAATSARGTASPGTAGAQTREVGPRDDPGWTRYENLGNPGWCLDGNGRDAYIHRCGSDFQVWYYTHGSVGFQLLQAVTRTCLTGEYGPWGSSVRLEACSPNWDRRQRWDALPVNGHVVLKNHESEFYDGPMCLIPDGITLKLWRCPRDIPGNVPNAFAWDYFR